MDYKPSEIKLIGKETFRPHLATLAVITLIFMLVNSLLSGDAYVRKSLISTLIFCLITGPLTLSSAMIYFRLSCGPKPQATDVLLGFQKNFVSAVFLAVLRTIFIFLWSLLLVVPGLIKAYSYSMSAYILAREPEIDPNDAIKKSMAFMDGHKLDLLVLHISFIGWLLLTAVTAGIAGLYAIPYMNASVTEFFNRVYEERTGISGGSGGYGPSDDDGVGVFAASFFGGGEDEPSFTPAGNVRKPEGFEEPPTIIDADPDLDLDELEDIEENDF